MNLELFRTGWWAKALALAAATAPIAAGAATVVLGAEDDAAPWSYPDGTGYVNDLVQAAFREVGWTVEQKVLPYARCKALATKGGVAGCFSVGRRPELEADLVYADEPVFGARNILFARGDSPLNGCDPSRWPGRPQIGLVRGYEYVDRVESLAHDRLTRIDITNSDLINLRKVQAGHIQAAVVNVDEVKPIGYVATLAGVRDDFKAVCDFGALPAYVAFSRIHPQGAQALAAFNEGYARLKRRGAVPALQLAWRTRAMDKLGVVKR